MSNFETRTFTEGVEIRAEGGKQIAVGYAAKFNSQSRNLGGFVETIRPGAFTKTLQEADIRGLFNHDVNLLLGRTAAGTVRLEEDNVGLRYEIDLPDTTLGRDLAELLKRGDITGSSFGFRPIDEEWGETASGFPERSLISIALRDIGPVTFPAYDDSESALRSLAETRSLDADTVLKAASEDRLQEVLRTDPVVVEEDKASEKVAESSQETPTTPAKYLHLRR